MALLPSWGSLLKTGVITEDNILEYGSFLADRYKNYSNIIWVLGGDIKAEDYKAAYRKLGAYLKFSTPNKLITFHPFGRCSSTMWMNGSILICSSQVTDVTTSVILVHGTI